MALETMILRRFVFLFAFLLMSCTSQSSRIQEPQLAESLKVPYERGRTIYQTQCTACHNSDPHKAGSIGPDLHGSSKDLIAARILRGEYPAGYRPKRETHQMPPLPHLKNEIDALATYLNHSP